VTISDSEIRALSSGSSLNGVVLWFEGYVSRDREWDPGCGMVGVGGSRDIRGVALSSPKGSSAVSSGGSSAGAGFVLHRQILLHLGHESTYSSLVNVTALALPLSSSLNISTNRS
jgi:hypothetical protein